MDQQQQQQEEIFHYNGQRPSQIPRDVTHVRCDSSVTEIPEACFQRCRNLITVELNEGLVEIAPYAFNRCTSMKTINFPSTLKVIGKEALSDCHKLEDLNLKEGLIILGDFAFAHSNLRSINLPSTIKKIPNHAFRGCSNIVDLILPNGIVVVGPNSFSGCKHLRVVSIASSVERIENGAFRDCERLYSLELHRGLQSIGAGAFRGCAWLNRAAIPSTVKTLDARAFASCTKLVSVELSEGLEEIKDGAFAECERLQNLYIPSSVIKLGRIFKHSYKPKPPLLLGRKFRMHDDGDGNCAQLIHALQTRFRRLPIHEICYFQSHDETVSLVENLEQIVKSNGHSNRSGGGGNRTGAAATTKATTTTTTFSTAERDSLTGMTPLHILALSRKPNIDVFRTVLALYPKNFLMTVKDARGYRAIDYLIENESPGSDELTKQLLGDRIEWLGLERWKRKVVNVVDNFPVGWDMNYRARQIDHRHKHINVIYAMLIKYERLEILSLLELLLWKLEIDKTLLLLATATKESDVASLSTMPGDRISTSASTSSNSSSSSSVKEISRVNCGADIVISNVLPFLDNVKFDESGISIYEETDIRMVYPIPMQTNL